MTPVFGMFLLHISESCQHPKVRTAHPRKHVGNGGQVNKVKGTTTAVEWKLSERYVRDAGMTFAVEG